MNLVFLESGQACYLKEKIGDKFIVNKVYELESEYEGVIDFVSQDDIVVNEVFNTPPVEKIESLIKECLLKEREVRLEIEKLLAEKKKIEYELKQIKKSKIDQECFIVDKSELINAKSIALFPSSRVMPILLNEKDVKGIGVTIRLDIRNNEESSWGYKVYNFDGNKEYSDFLCKKYGILINPTQEQIDETIMKRLSEFDFSEYEIIRVPNKYLSESQIKVKTELERKDRAFKLESLRAEAERADLKLKDFLKTIDA